MGIKAIFWDLGGVIVTDNVQPAFKKFGIPYVENRSQLERDLEKYL